MFNQFQHQSQFVEIFMDRWVARETQKLRNTANYKVRNDQVLGNDVAQVTDLT